jgi:hypothetical protein
MSMGFLLPRSASDPDSNVDTPLVWRGLMVQKAVQQLLFDVDWRTDATSSGSFSPYLPDASLIFICYHRTWLWA